MKLKAKTVEMNFLLGANLKTKCNGFCVEHSLAKCIGTVSPFDCMLGFYFLQGREETFQAFDGLPSP